jgi:hypothetical protein
MGKSEKIINEEILKNILEDILRKHLNEDEIKNVKVNIIDKTFIDKFPTFLIDVKSVSLPIFTSEISRKILDEFREKFVSIISAARRFGYVEASIPQHGFKSKYITFRLSVR